MENNLKYNLEALCLSFLGRLESFSDHEPIGTCYLIGHCLAEGFKNVGLTAREVTGTAIYKDKKGNNIIYGKSLVKGCNVGFYHTWCELQIDNQNIIVDPSYKYNKLWIRSHNLKLNKNIPDIIITDRPCQWFHTFIEDSSLQALSKYSLSQIDPIIIGQLIDEVESFLFRFHEDTKNLD